jgi:hypothetical protein
MLEVKDLGAEPTARERRKDTIDLAPPTAAHEESMRAYREVDAMVNELAAAGREVITSRDVTDLYDARVANGAPKLTPNALARALKACGCANWRNAKTRGFKIPTASSLEVDELGTRKHIPHVKGRSVMEDMKAYHSISRLADGTPLFDDPVEHTEGPLGGGNGLYNGTPSDPIIDDVDARIEAGLPPF